MDAMGVVVSIACAIGAMEPVCTACYVVVLGLSCIAMALRLAQLSCGLQLCWAAGGITLLALRFCLSLNSRVIGPLSW